MERRSFLKGALALAVVPVLPSAGQAFPTIYGDGVRDDTAGLQALFDGKPFMVGGEGFTATEGRLLGGVFRLTKTLVMRENFSVHECRFEADHGDTILRVEK